MQRRLFIASIPTWIVLAMLVAGSFPGGSSDMALPVEDQIPLFLKILSYDKSLVAQQDSIVVGVLYQDRYRTSLVTKNQALDVLDRFSSVSGHPLSSVPVSLDDVALLGSKLAMKGITVLYVTPLRSFDLTKITDVSRSKHMVTLTGVPQYLNSGLSVSLDSRGGKPNIIINLDASLTEGARFHSQLLKLAKIISSHDG